MVHFVNPFNTSDYYNSYTMTYTIFSNQEVILNPLGTDSLYDDGYTVIRS